MAKAQFPSFTFKTGMDKVKIVHFPKTVALKAFTDLKDRENIDAEYPTIEELAEVINNGRRLQAQGHLRQFCLQFIEGKPDDESTQAALNDVLAKAETCGSLAELREKFPVEKRERTYGPRLPKNEAEGEEMLAKMSPDAAKNAAIAFLASQGVDVSTLGY